MSLVEYHDPDGLFPVLWPLLSARLPLQNLNWKSPSRPVRSIASLQVHFEAAGQQQRSATADQEQTHLGKAEKSRRHQIPGLHQTPYLRLFVLRCDDRDQYKSTSRDLLRQWVDETSPVSQSSAASRRQSNHDACEWLILHVVLPDTAAAAEPRWSKKSPHPDEEGPKEKSSSSRWTGRGTSTILERLRADFNATGKTAIDRIAQVRLQKELVPAYFAPALPLVGPAPPQETAQEQENAWTDLITKFKTLILTSFDKRVTQYEDDIREREAQRLLPGWNFNTFFVLKEGLAMAFESVGLTEDALAGYDELAAGLEMTMRDTLARQGSTQANSFPACTPELLQKLKSLDTPAGNNDAPVNPPHGLFGSSQKPYRERIVANSCSLFDFFCYLFSRQTMLLLRLAKGVPSQQQAENGGSSALTSSSADAVPLIEVCRRGIQFVTLIARIMRKDLSDGALQLSLTLDQVGNAISGLVSTWMFSILEQLLENTKSTNLPDAPPDRRAALNRSPNRGPSRRSASPMNAKVRNALGSSDHTAEVPHHRSPSPQDASASFNNPTLQDLAARRAELLLLQRKALEASAQTAGLNIWATQPGAGNKSSSTLDEDYDPSLDSSDGASDFVPVWLTAAESTTLKHSLMSLATLKQLFEAITVEAAWCFSLSKRNNAAGKLSIDLATLKFNEGDYAAAAAQLSRIIPVNGNERWSAMEASLLSQYAQCLKALHRRDEYVRTVLSMVAKAADPNKSTSRCRSSNIYPGTDITAVMKDIITYSHELPYDLSIQATNYFKSIQVDRFIHLFPHRDGFRLCLNAQQVVVDELHVEKARIRLVSASASQQLEIWLETDEPFTLGTALSKIWLSSNVTTAGAEFIVDHIAFSCGRIVFNHETMARVDSGNLLRIPQPSSAEQVQAVKDATILCYPRVGAFSADTDRARLVHVNGPKYVDVEISSGENDISALQAVVRANSAGLRLRTADAQVTSGDVALTEQTQPGVWRFGKMRPYSRCRVSLPFSVEESLDAVSIRFEFRYTTADGEFSFLLHKATATGLLIDISVQDIFKADALFSKFFIAPAVASPCHILKSQLQSSDEFAVEDSVQQFLPTMTFSHEPACLTYKIHRKEQRAESQENAKDARLLSLSIDYRTVQEDAIFQISNTFEKDLETGAISHLRRLLVPRMENRARAVLSSNDYELAAFMAEIRVPSFAEMEWQDIVVEIPTESRQDMAAWLRQWHEQHAVIALDDNKNSGSAVRQLKIDFQVPDVKFLHTASIELLGRQTGSALHPPVASVGETMLAALHIKFTRCWHLAAPSTASSSADEGDSDSQSQPDGHAFTYEILADSSQWLVGGEHKAQFTAREGQDVSFQLLLIPMASGQLLLPTVAISTTERAPGYGLELEREREQAQAAASGDGQSWSCETDCVTQSTTVLVVDSLTSTTVGLGVGNAIGDEVQLLEAESVTLPPGA